MQDLGPVLGQYMTRAIVGSAALAALLLCGCRSGTGSMAIRPEKVSVRSSHVQVRQSTSPPAPVSNRDLLVGSPLDLEERRPRWGRLRLDLGVGEAPFDDVPPGNSLLPAVQTGFSDTLIQVHVEEPVGPGLTLVGSMAATRHQDEPLLAGLEDAEFAWFTIGLRLRF